MRKILLIVSLLFSMNVAAVPLTALLNNGSIQVGDTLFDQWEVLQDISSSGLAVNTDDIEVTGLMDGGLNPGPGLNFTILNNALSVDGDGIFAFLDFMFGFRASTVDPTLKIKDNSLLLSDYALTNPTSVTSVYIEEKIYSDPNRNNELGTKAVEGSDVFGFLTENLSDNADFAASSEIWVTKNILLEAWDFGESATLISFEQRFSQTQNIPEPTTLLLFTLGILGVLTRKNKVRA